MTVNATSTVTLKSMPFISIYTASEAAVYTFAVSIAHKRLDLLTCTVELGVVPDGDESTDMIAHFCVGV